MVDAAGTRAFMRWMDKEGRPVVGAVDLATRTFAWQGTGLPFGGFVRSLLTRSAVVVYAGGSRPLGSPPVLDVAAIDQATGRVLWTKQLRFDASPVADGDLLILGGRAVDARTGDVRWSDPASAVTDQALAAGVLLQRHPGGGVVERDPRTGVRGPQIGLARSDSLLQMTPCFEDRLCFLSDAVGGVDAVVVVDRSTGAEVWRRPSEGFPELVADGGELLVRADDHSVVFRADGTIARDLRGWAGWLGGGELLLFRSAPGSRFTAEVVRADGGHQVLGDLTVRPQGCAWTETVLVCPASDGLREWVMRVR